ncbi:hypothetical protein V3C99_017189 [Haemonchus contortus]|uniref:Rx_N domain-containing protein n=1 Tax=Haemonchus contortus TaxID=6289 RepID=A0A7I4Z8A8_HAECO
MRQTLLVLATMVMDLVKELRRLGSLENAGEEVANLDLVLVVNILEWDNRTLHDSVKAWQEYKALEKQTAGNPELAEHTAGRLRSIHSVMDELGRDAGNWETSIKISKRRKTVRVSD